MVGFFLSLIFCLAATSSNAQDTVASPNSELQELINDAMAEYKALAAADDEFSKLRAQHSLSKDQETDYRLNVKHLRARLRQSCATLEREGVTELPPDLPCSIVSEDQSAPLQIDPSTSKTQDERTAAIDAKLGAALANFDEMLLREQEKIRANAPPFESASVSSGQRAGADGGSAQGQQESQRDGETQSAASEEGDETGAQTPTAGANQDQSPDAAGAGRPSNPSNHPSSPAPRNVPDGSDDDVVARQLREAAESENDPVLKKKLWDEYRKYKSGTR